jgi:hypothetical protein
MTAATLLRIVGTAVDQDARDMLAAADARVLLVLYANGAFITGDSHHYAAFEDIANACQGPMLREAKRELEAFPQGKGKTHAIDVACNLYVWQLDAAYYLGLAIGLRMAQSQEADQ